MNWSKILVHASVLMFVFPILVFVFNALRGVIDPFVLWFSSTQIYYAARFVDMEVVAKPTWAVTRLLSIAFLLVSLIFASSALLNMFSVNETSLNAVLTFAFFFSFAARSMMINGEVASSLRRTHPNMFLETKTSAYYNFVAAFLLTFSGNRAGFSRLRAVSGLILPNPFST